MPRRTLPHLRRRKMHKLKLLKCHPEDQMRLIVESKRGANRTVLDAAFKRVAGRYDLLEQYFNMDDLETLKIASWSDDQKKALLHCYTSEVARLTELKSLIKAAQPRSIRSICPYCGIGSPVQFDHYLPKSAFPEFAVHAYNLSPCCGPCNGLKGETWLVNKARSFVNVYLDSLPTASIIETTVTWRTYRKQLVPTISFDLVRPVRFSKERFELLERHFERLDLLGRYSDEAPAEFDEFLDNAATHDAADADELKVELQNFIDRRTLSLGPLHWKLSLYQALVADQTFIDLCFA